MAYQEIDLDTEQTGGHRGDPPRTAWTKAIAMFQELYRKPAGIGANLLINGDMRINQRVFAGGALAAGAFGYDRMFAAAGGCNVTVSAAGVINHVSGTWCQAIEAPRGVFGTTVTVRVDDLSGGNLTGSVGGVAFSITPGAGARYANVVVPAGSGNLVARFTGTNITYRNAGVVRGGDMDGFEYRAIPFEMGMCQRYYQAYSGLRQIGYTTAGSAMAVPMIWSTPMRATPGATMIFESSGNVNQGASGFSSVSNVRGNTFFISIATGNTDCQYGIRLDAEITS